VGIYRRKVEEYHAVQWHPDRVTRPGKRDKWGVEYTPMGFLFYGPNDASPARIRPGCWIVTIPGGDKVVYTAERFAALYEPAGEGVV
jgi:hypothetical protein